MFCVVVGDRFGFVVPPVAVACGPRSVARSVDVPDRSASMYACKDRCASVLFDCMRASIAGPAAAAAPIDCDTLLASAACLANICFDNA